MSQEIDDLKTKFDAKAAAIQGSLENISADIQKLQKSPTLSQSDKDKLAAIGATVDSLAASAEGIADLEK